MDKTFEDIINETLQEDFGDAIGTDNDTETPDLESTPESDVNDESDNNDVAMSNDEDEDGSSDEIDLDISDEEVESPSVNQKDVDAFAQMRINLKQTNDKLANAEKIVEFFDSRAKQMGYQDVQGLIDRTLEAELAKQAEEKGIPVDFLKRLNDLEDKVKRQDVEKEQMILAQKEQALNAIFDEFTQNHSLSNENVANIAQSLVKDGFSLEGLMDMPKSAVNRILNAYLPNEVVKQDTLAKKEKIKKELPANTGNTSSKFNTDEQIDAIAKKFMSGY